MAIAEAKILGRALKLRIGLEERRLAEGEDPVAAVAAAGPRAVLLDLPLAEVEAVAAALGDRDDLLLFNIRHPDDALRAEHCAANLLHTIPSRSMTADAMAQFLAARGWRRGAAARRARSGEPGRRRRLRGGGGEVRARDRRDPALRADQRPAPARAQQPRAADRRGRLRRRLRRRRGGRVRPLRALRDLRAAAGGRQRRAQGAGLALEPRALRRPAAQPALRPPLRRPRCRRRTGPPGPPSGPWSRRSPRPAAPTCRELRAFIESDDFALDLYKGLPGSYRPWDGQLRQQVVLADSDATIAVAPLPQFLHETNVLDTLGADRPQTACASR